MLVYSVTTVFLTRVARGLLALVSVFFSTFGASFATALASLDFNRAAFFLWIKCVFAALSSLLKASLKLLASTLMRAFLTAVLRAVFFDLLRSVRAASWRIFLIAFFNKGICGLFYL